jgi:glycosyltransferase involved in cell wall biosynthesis
LLVGGYDAAETRKGFAILRDALEELLASAALADCLPPGATVHIGLFGKSTSALRFPNCKILAFGNVDDDVAMADILGLADLIAVPSIEDNYPNLVLEAMSCGTPSLGFAAGGVPEMICDGITGVLAPDVGSMQGLKDGILRFARDYFGDTGMRRACRAAVEETNHPQAIGRRLRQLYESALGRPLRSASTGVHRRIAKTLANAEMLPDLRLGADFLQFPANYSLRRRGADDSAAAQAVAAEVPQARPGMRLITVRTRHEHHASRSGPYQFLRHLPEDAYDLSHVTVPLGSELAGPAASLYQRAGSFLGTRAFAHANNWLAEADLAGRCIAGPVDLVHFIDGEHGGWLLPSLPAALFGAAGRPRFVTTLHQPPAGLEPLVNHGLLGRQDAIIVLCHAQKDYLRDHVDPARVFVVPHGVDTDFFHPSSPEAAAGRPNNRFRLLLVGHWLRDFDSVFAALELLAQAGIAADLTIVSPVQVNRPASVAVTVLSDLSDQALRDAYRSADALVLPLLDATANNAILEAMACGIPVISTRVGGVPEMVGSDAGILCPPRDARSLADAVARLATRPTERTAMGQAARRRAEELDWREIAQRHHALYQAVRNGAGNAAK